MNIIRLLTVNGIVRNVNNLFINEKLLFTKGVIK